MSAQPGRHQRPALDIRLALALGFLLSVTLWAVGCGLMGTVPAEAAPSVGPCDIYALSGTPCVAAYSTTRAMYAGYQGPLYAISRASDKATLDISTLASGFADADAQDRFCAGTTCEITELFDQSPDHNDLTIEGPGANGGQDSGVAAGALPISVDGQQAYGMDFEPGMGYRDNTTLGMATGSGPESMYMVTSGTHDNSGCCFDFGNAETTGDDDGNGHMDALYFGTDCWLAATGCPPGGPWVQADLENGIIASDDGKNLDPSYTGSTSPFVTAMLENNGTNAMVLAAANAQAGPLDPLWVGALPSNHWDPDPPTFIVPYPDNPSQTEVVNPLLSGYAPMHKEGAIVLGTGGDNSNQGVGSFFEGAITAGIPSLATEAAIQTDITGADYASTGSAPASDTPQFAVVTQTRQAVAAVVCPLTCRARMTMTLKSPRVRRRLVPVRVRGALHTLSGATVVRLALPPQVVRLARRSGLTQLVATVTVRAATVTPGTPAVARTVRLHIRL